MKKIDAIELVKYSKTEEILNSATHIFGAVITFIATIICVNHSLSLERTDYLVIGLIYCLSMLTVFVCSAVYHGLPPCRAKKVMRVIDYTSIYLMLMGTITPYMLLSVAKVNYKLGWILFTVCLVATVISIFLTLTTFSKTKAIRMILYIVIGLCAFSSIFVVGNKVDPNGVRLVIAGNGAYIIGLTLFAVGVKRPYFHTAFHILVIFGALIHYVNLYQYVF